MTDRCGDKVGGRREGWGGGGEGEGATQYPYIYNIFFCDIR